MPPSQAELMVEALEGRGVPYAYLTFEGEQHGFRKAESIVRATEAELAFYGRVLGFTRRTTCPRSRSGISRVEETPRRCVGVVPLEEGARGAG